MDLSTKILLYTNKRIDTLNNSSDRKKKENMLFKCCYDANVMDYWLLTLLRRKKTCTTSFIKVFHW